MVHPPFSAKFILQYPTQKVNVLSFFCEMRLTNKLFFFHLLTASVGAVRRPVQGTGLLCGKLLAGFSASLQLVFHLRQVFAQIVNRSDGSASPLQISRTVASERFP